MSRFGRTGHWRTNANGTTFYVREHMVYRDHWDINALRLNHFGQKVYYASDFLRRNNVGLGKQGCFVNPNARCPVCSKPVFFYSNQYGSRVYFDDLGPPWPKHPCTDNPVRKIVDSQNWGGISKRPKGLTIELIENANIAGLFHRKEYGQRKTGEWTLLLIEEVLRNDKKNTIKAIFLDSSTGEKRSIICFSTEPLFKDNDLLAWNGSLFSFILPDKLTEVIFKEGGFIETRLNETPKEKKSTQVQSIHTGASKPDISGAKTHVSTLNVTFEPSLTGWTDWDKKAFSPKTSTLPDFIRKHWAILDACVKEGLRTSDAIAQYLNARGHLTAEGKPWNGRLAVYLYFLASLDPFDLFAVEDGPLKLSEMKHFGSFDGPSDEFLQKMDRAVQKLQRQGSNNAKTIAERLNRIQHLTFIGSPWTQRTAFFLVELIKERRRRIYNATRRSQNSSQPLSKTKNSDRQTNSTDEYLNSEIQKWEKLGRVIVRKKKIEK